MWSLASHPGFSKTNLGEGWILPWWTPLVYVAGILVAVIIGGDIVDTVGMDDGCIVSPQRYRTLGVDKYGECEFATTANVLTYTLPEIVEQMVKAAHDRG